MTTTARPPSRLPLEVAALVSLLVWLGLAYLVVFALVGCAAPLRPPTVGAPAAKVEPRAASSWSLHCHLSDLPDPPDIAPAPTPASTPDVLYRVFVHRVDFDALLQYERDLRVWAGSLAVCAANLMEVAHLPEHL